MKKSIYLVFQGFYLFAHATSIDKIDLTVVGGCKHADGLARIAPGIIKEVCGSLNVNFKPTIQPDYNDIEPHVVAIANNPNKTSGTVAILTDIIWDIARVPVLMMPDSKIKLAYTMFESTEIPPKWVELINQKLDGIVVPDPWLVEMYQASGVNVPIFVIPMGLDLEDYLAKPLKRKRSAVFTFGMTARFGSDKNQEMVIKAFEKLYKNRKDVRLKIHGRFGTYAQELIQYVQSRGITNIQIIHKVFNAQEYRDFMESVDCYVLLSKGEGYSITPREALALGVPCIITDNSSHQTICKSGCVRVVPSAIPEPAWYDVMRRNCGNRFNCRFEDAIRAFDDVYTNYAQHLKNAARGRNWVKQYLHENVRDCYLSLFKPKKVVLGSENSSANGVVVTTSQSLYQKYLDAIKQY